MKGKEDKPYAVCSGSLEFNSNPRTKYIANIMQITPITVYWLIWKEIFPHQADDNYSHDISLVL